MATEIDDLPGEQVPVAPSAPAAPAPAAPPAPEPPSLAARIDADEPEGHEYDPAVDGWRSKIAAKKPDPPAAPEPAPAPAPTPAPAARPAHNPHLAAMAKDFGFSDAEIAEHTPEELTIVVRQLTRQQLRQQQLAAMPPAKPAPPPEPEPELDIDFGDAAKNYDPELIGLLKKAATAAAKAQADKVKALEGKLAAREQADAARQRAEFFNAADAHFAKNERLYGKGDQRTVDTTSPAFLRRTQIIDFANARGVSFAQAEAAIFGDLLGAAPAAPPARQPATPPAPAPEPVPAAGPSPLDVWNSAALQPPTQRKHAEPKGVKLARKEVAEWLQNNANGTVASIHGEGGEEDELLP